MLYATKADTISINVKVTGRLNSIVTTEFVYIKASLDFTFKFRDRER